MSKKDSKDVSVRGETYAAVRDYCKEQGVSISPEVSKWVDEHFDRLEAGAETPEEKAVVQRPALSPAEIEAEARKHFTF